MEKIFLIVLLTSMTACRLPLTPDAPQPVQAPRDKIQAITIRQFPEAEYENKTILLFNNKSFLWKDDRSSEDVAVAMKVGKEIERLDDLAFPVNRQERELERLAAPLKKQSRDLGLQATAHSKSIEKKTKELATAQDEQAQKLGEKTQAQADLDAELAKAPTAQDPAKIAALQKQLSDIAAALVVIGQRLVILNTDIGALQVKMDECTRKKNETDTSYLPMAARLSGLHDHQKRIQDEGQAQVEQLAKAVDYFKDQPSKVSIQFLDNGVISAEIRDFNLTILNGRDIGERLRNFSTEDDTIQNVTYRSKGGEFQMTVQVYSLESLDRRETARVVIGELEAQIDALEREPRSEATDKTVSELKAQALEARRAYESAFKNLVLLRTLKITARRARYDLTDRDGRIFFSGEVEQIDADGKVRKGIAKFVDKLN